MKSQFSYQIFFTVVVLLLTFLYTFPSTPLWEKCFGALTYDEQVAVPFRLLEMKASIQQEVTPEQGVAPPASASTPVPTSGAKESFIVLAVDNAAPVFARQNALRPEDVLNSVAETIRRKFLDIGLQAAVVNPDYSKGVANIRIQEKSLDELKTLLPDLNLYAALPLELARIFPQSRITMGLDLRGGIDLVYQVDTQSIDKEDSVTDAVQRSVEIIRNRVDIFGIAEPSIKAQEGNRIRIQLPGVKDPERVKSLIQSTAMLKFHLVKDQALTATQLEPVDQATEIVLFEPASKKQAGKWYKLVKTPEVTGRDLKYAKVGFDDMGVPIVHLEFNPAGANKFANTTGNHVQEQLAIVLDNKVHSAPVIQQRITGGMAQITGHFTLEEAQNLSIVLRAGALPANLILLESRVVGPTLGAESVKAGVNAGILGIALVLVFMVVYYKVAGFLADIAVVFNTFIVFGALVAFGGTLTLPGIAGLILSVGMAVDANVIIFERIREELRAGKTTRAAIESGFDRALACIIDSNVTTILTVLILYIFGSGPIRGFATTLGFGLVANIFTAIVGVKMAMDMLWGRPKAASMSI